MNETTGRRACGTRIQRANRERILDAGLEIFSRYGFKGSTIDQIAAKAGMSKPNLLYYFRRKGEVYDAVLGDLLSLWLDPLREMRAEGEPLDEIRRYVFRKLEISRDRPRESRLFANEMLTGAPRIHGLLAGELKTLVDEKASVMRGWIENGTLAPVDPYHLIFSVWATTQHYADFDVQVRAVLGGGKEEERFHDAAAFLARLYTYGLAPG
ncbi:TetR family transcriptional regulator C-terminal domain-containing protein [Pararhizobium mangrovi]|uniref:TetR family transcriptional regulator n=1 Tax=Pararhizobium mangrovi TaxID=2590452 RepID=A0A506UA07_9HYPH|nr:TetR family transcriptional regulator C-terminal domain-containing protein [Pararhizobium mangrovi]TPW31272.1 TetR family transcriptional regulator [Pararhizobium mangrovi]